MPNASLNGRQVLHDAIITCPDKWKLGKNCTVGAQPQLPAGSKPWHELARDGLVQVREYTCSACAGDPPQDDRFGRASIAIVRSGVFGIRTDRRTELLTGGFLLLGNAGQTFEASHEYGGGDRCLVFEFPEGVLEDLAESMKRGAQGRPFAVNVLAPLPRADAMMHLAEERLGSEASVIGLEEIGLSLAKYVLGEAGSGVSRPGVSGATGINARARERIIAAIEQMERSAQDDLGLAELAESAGMSPFKFLRMFKKEAGVTPYRFLLRARIRQAVALLRDTSRPVTDIAFDVGFGDLSNFINAFRREVGCSPSQYRKSGLSRIARPEQLRAKCHET